MNCNICNSVEKVEEHHIFGVKTDLLKSINICRECHLIIHNSKYSVQFFISEVLRELEKLKIDETKHIRLLLMKICYTLFNNKNLEEYDYENSNIR